jgi:hypothetical protein
MLSPIHPKQSLPAGSVIRNGIPPVFFRYYPERPARPGGARRFCVLPFKHKQCDRF